jgi:Histidine kinase-, DNA gyrase B-, and HSP90-like ATPase
LQSSQLAEKSAWHFDVSTGLKRVLGRELITDDEVAILEMVKNSFDASADRVAIWFGPQSIVIADNGIGMSFNDLHSKWLFVAYSAKRPENTSKDYRDRAAERGHFAGSKGVGRFSSDRLGEELVLQTRPANPKATTVHSLFVDWNSFEHDDTQHFEKIPVSYSTSSEFELPDELRRFGASLSHGTVIQIRKLRRPWDRDRLLALKSSLAKLINPFGDEVDKFAISIIAPAEMQQDEAAKANAKEAGEKVIPGKLVNGRVGNFIFSALKEAEPNRRYPDAARKSQFRRLV